MKVTRLIGSRRSRCWCILPNSLPYNCLHFSQWSGLWLPSWPFFISSFMCSLNLDSFFLIHRYLLIQNISRLGVTLKVYIKDSTYNNDMIWIRVFYKKLSRLCGQWRKCACFGMLYNSMWIIDWCNGWCYIFRWFWHVMRMNDEDLARECMRKGLKEIVPEEGNWWDGSMEEWLGGLGTEFAERECWKLIFLL